MAHHENNGHCEKCQEIMDRFPRFSVLLRNWFEKMQEKNPSFHCSDAGRGHVDQELYYHRGASNASWTESSHNYNAGLDTFWLVDGKYSLDRSLYDEYISPNIPEWLQWGARWKTFPELPHFEIKIWRNLADGGAISLVEPDIKKAAA